MKFTQFTINNYRAINEINIDLSYSINPLIGVNESGKTSILQAILAFDKEQDRLTEGYHLECSNRYETIQNQDCQIIAHLELSDSDFDQLIKYLKVKTDDPIVNILKQFKKSKNHFVISRRLSSPSREYFLHTPSIEDPGHEKKIISFITSNQPYILYFDDFSDRVPSEVSFNVDYVKTGIIKGRINREWQLIIEEIFNRAGTTFKSNKSTNETPLQAFMKLTDKDIRDGVLYDITDILETEIITEWKKMKKRGHKQLADDSEKLELLINYDESASTFEFKVRDKSKGNKKRIFNITQRSKGFQWFFNYMIKLKFNPRYKGSKENSIYLLDEPGSYLHATAQRELLKELQKVSKTNTLLYCTHSHYLLDPTIIKLGSIKIAEKIEANISLIKYGNYKGSSHFGALSPVHQALQLNTTNEFIGKVVIFEGITDFYFFSMLQSASKLIKQDIRLIAGAGSGASTTLISLALSFSKNFLVILDNDKGGKDAKKKYSKEFEPSIMTHFKFYSDKNNSTLESIFSNNDSTALLNLTGVNSIKRALGILFYDMKDSHRTFIDGLSEETKTNLKKTLEAINLL